MKKEINVLFVCLGNICRSPVAEGIFNSLLVENGIDKYVSCESAGTAGYHIGATPDIRSIENAAKNKVTLNSLARKFEINDLEQFNYILAMDQSNFDSIVSIGYSISCKSVLHKMRDFDVLEKGSDVPDPYYGGDDGFQLVFDILYRSNKKFLEYLITEHKL